MYLDLLKAVVVQLKCLNLYNTITHNIIIYFNINIKYRLLEAYYQGYVPDLMTNTTYKTAITNTLNWFVNSQFSDGNIPTYSTEFDICANVYGNDSDGILFNYVLSCHINTKLQYQYT